MRARQPLIGFAVLLAAGCAAPAPDPSESAGDPALASDFDDTASPTSFEEQEIKMVDATRSGQNTYGQGCKVVGERFANEPWRDDLAARIQSTEPTPLEHLSLPSPKYPREFETVNAVCRIVFDLNPDGAPVNVSAQCSDPRFEDAAIRGMDTARFRIGPDTPLTALVYPMEFCTNA